MVTTEDEEGDIVPPSTIKTREIQQPETPSTLSDVFWWQQLDKLQAGVPHKLPLDKAAAAASAAASTGGKQDIQGSTSPPPQIRVQGRLLSFQDLSPSSSTEDILQKVMLIGM